MKTRKNAHRDEFVLPGELRENDWRFDRITRLEECFFAWQIESRRQIAGSGRAWLDLPELQRDEIAAQYILKGNQVVSKHTTPVFEFRQKLAGTPPYLERKPGRLILTLEVDCCASIDDVLLWMRNRLRGDKAFQSCPKKSAGRRNANSYRIKLRRLAVTRLLHSLGSAPEAVERFNSSVQGRETITVEDCIKFRSETEKALKKIKSAGEN